MSAGLQLVDDASRDLLIAEPYFGHLLVGTVRACLEGDFIARLAVGGHGHTARIEVGTKRFAALSKEKRKAALKHELLHLTFKHPLRARAYPLLGLWGLACDLVVNQLLDTRDLDAPFVIDDFDLPKDESADVYYATLLPLYERVLREGSCRTPAEKAMQSWCGGACSARGAHSSWESFATLASATLSVLETNIDALIEATVRRARCRRWGNMPGRLLEHLESLIDKRNEVPWRRVLRLFGATSERTYLKNTIARPSKRYGTCPGIRVRRKTDVVVAVDTSGSVDVEDIALFFGEIHAMWRRGAHVVVLECDAAVVREYPYRGAPPSTVGGRGGTSFDPAIARANTLRPDALIYFTDGEAPAPERKARMPVLWVLSSAGRATDEAEHLPGRRVKLKRDRGAGA
jgi:predicted metal-dependent peptidase